MRAAAKPFKKLIDISSVLELGKKKNHPKNHKKTQMKAWFGSTTQVPYHQHCFWVQSEQSPVPAMLSYTFPR